MNHVELAKVDWFFFQTQLASELILTSSQPQKDDKDTQTHKPIARCWKFVA